MTRRERLTAIFDGRAPDRPAVKVWGADPRGELTHPAFEPVRRAALEKTDLVLSARLPFDVYAGRLIAECTESSEEPTASPDWVHAVRVFHTPAGDLREVYQKSTRRRPGYEREHPLKEPADIRRLLSLPYEPHPLDPAAFHETDRLTGDRGLPLFGVDHAMYALQRLIGSENFALWSLSDGDLLLEAMQVFAGRIRRHVQAALDAGLRRIVFGWVGPELCIPPLMPPAAFQRFVFDLDQPLIDLIHDAGGRVWVHCHGRVKGLIDSFCRMGVDVLNPIEPPPMGDLTMAEAFALAGGRMGLEGGIETHDFMTAPAACIRAQFREVLAAGSGRRLILCPSSGYTENPEPSPAEIANWLCYIDEGVRAADAMCT